MAKVNFSTNMRAGGNVKLDKKKETDDVITVDTNTVVPKNSFFKELAELDKILKKANEIPK